MVELMRTALYVPGNRRDMLRKAPTYGADVVIADLEDSIPAAEKAAARATVEQTIEAGELSAARVVVRINGLNTLESSLDVKAAVRPGVWGLKIPKVNSPAELRELDSVVADLEGHAGLERGAIRFLPTIETPLAVVRAYEITSASPRVAAVTFGGEDLLVSLGIERSPEELELLHARGATAIAAAAVGVPAIDGVYTNYMDEEGLVEQTGLIKQLGFSGRSVIHPRQIAPVHRVFSPAPEEVEHARSVVEAYEQAAAAGRGSVGLDGKMIDLPVVRRAQNTLARAESLPPTDQ